ncbi:hypothetical protein ATKI12_3465 [Kitasatospora sp. Ki12]
MGRTGERAVPGDGPSASRVSPGRGGLSGNVREGDSAAGDRE